MLCDLAAIQTLISRGALFALSHSGGKDSQAMTLQVRQVVPREQLAIVHADLGDVHWPGTLEHIQATAGDLPIIVARAQRSFLEMVERRGRFPSPQQRQCTSDLKRGPIEREIRRYLRARPEFSGVVVNCMGLRAEESSSRARRQTLRLISRNSVAGREWYDWLPIHSMATDEVFSIIAKAGQCPHWAYAAGMSRLSCCFCIMASVSDLTTAARLMPELYAKYVTLERKLGHTLSMSQKTLEQLTQVKVADLLQGTPSAS